MNAEVFSDWLLRSLATGAIAFALVQMCPRSWRGRFRLTVPVAAFCALLLMACWLVRPLHRFEIPTSVPLTALAVPSNAGTWIVPLWAIGAVLFLARQAHGFVAVHQLLRGTRPVPGREWRRLLAECKTTLGLRGRVRARLAGPDFIPSATGLLRRVVLLPDQALNWTEDQRRLVLLHELGHFRRNDLWVDALGRLVCALHWFNPFVWMLHRQLAIEREYACDALVLKQGVARTDYAMVLWQMATAARKRPPISGAFLAMASPRLGKLEQRVRRILDSGRKVGTWLRIADGGLCLLLAAVLIACTACKPVARMLAKQAAWNPAEVQTRLLAETFPGN